MSKKKKSQECAECLKWRKAAQAVVRRYDAMGFRHNGDRAQGAEDVLNAMGRTAHNPDPHTVTSVAGLTTVVESW